MTKFVNFSAHNLTEEQITAAKQLYGADEIIHIPAPVVDEYASAEAVKALAEECAEKIRSYEPVAAMVAGQPEVVVYVTRLLKEAGVKVVNATTKRVAVESTNEKGEVVKTSKFKFVRFREFL